MFFLQESQSVSVIKMFFFLIIYGTLLFLHAQKKKSDNPNRHDVNAIADILGNGGIAIIPTDTLYAFVCSMEFKKSVESIARLKGFSLKQAKYSMLCCNLAQASEYVRPMDKETFALLKTTILLSSKRTMH